VTAEPPPGARKGASAKCGAAELYEDNEIAGIEKDQLGHREPGMVLAKSIKVSKVKANSEWEFTAGEALMVSRDGEKKYTSLQEASDDLPRLEGVYLHRQMVRRTVS
jgi:hypothetical protein